MKTELLMLATLPLLMISPPAAAKSLLLDEPLSSATITKPEENASRSDSFALMEHRALTPRTAGTATPLAAAATSSATSLPNRRHGARLRQIFRPLVHAAELRHALPFGLLDALILVESNYRPDAVSRVGAAGLAQLMPGTARGLGVADRFDAVANIDGGARYLKQMLAEFGVLAHALAAYNAGPGAVRRAGGIPRNGETPAYVAKVIAAWNEVLRGSGN